jgi:hypothetical protein
MLGKYETSSGTKPSLDLHFTLGSDLKEKIKKLMMEEV